MKDALDILEGYGKLERSPNTYIVYDVRYRITVYDFDRNPTSFSKETDNYHKVKSLEIDAENFISRKIRKEGYSQYFIQISKEKRRVN